MNFNAHPAPERRAQTVRDIIIRAIARYERVIVALDRDILDLEKRKNTLHDELLKCQRFMDQKKIRGSFRHPRKAHTRLLPKLKPTKKDQAGKVSP